MTSTIQTKIKHTLLRIFGITLVLFSAHVAHAATDLGTSPLVT